MSPWASCGLEPEERWHEWWAWHPVVIRIEGARAITFFEIVLRRRVNGRWEYQLVD